NCQYGVSKTIMTTPKGDRPPHRFDQVQDGHNPSDQADLSRQVNDWRVADATSGRGAEATGLVATDGAVVKSPEMLAAVYKQPFQNLPDSGGYGSKSDYYDAVAFYQERNPQLAQHLEHYKTCLTA
ncbi:MAG TPA: hypothetical protein V6C72_01480, partial [Chroococcales cyanobacterium]